MKWHTVSVNKPRGSYYKRKIYRNRLYISLSNLPTIPLSCLIIMIYTNIQNTCTILQIVPQSLLSLPPFGYCPFRKPLCRYLRPLSQPHLICYSMFSRFILPFQLRGIRLTRACSVLPAFPADTSCPACQTFPLHNNTSPFSWNFFTFPKGEKFPCEVIHTSPTLHPRSCARTLPHVASVIEGVWLRRDTYQKVITYSIHVRLDEMAPCIAFVTSDA